MNKLITIVFIVNCGAYLKHSLRMTDDVILTKLEIETRRWTCCICAAVFRRFIKETSKHQNNFLM